MYVITVPMVTFTIQNRVFHFGDGLVQRDHIQVIRSSLGEEIYTQKWNDHVPVGKRRLFGYGQISFMHIDSAAGCNC